MKFNRDCKSFPGTYACEVMTSEEMKDCTDCKFYEPISKKILLIKLGALGDIVRTTPLVKALKRKYGHNSHISWLIKPGDNSDILKDNPDIDNILEYSSTNSLRLKYEKFDVLLNLDIDSEATVIANTITAQEKYGFYFHEDGYPTAFNPPAERYLERAFSNKVSRENKKNYQETMFEIANLEYNREPISLHNIDAEYLARFKEKNKIQEDDKLICMNLGSGGRWPSKAWHKDNILELLQKLKDTKYRVLLRAGPNEAGLQSEILKKVKEQNIGNVFGHRNALNITIAQNLALLSICDKIITGDTLILHLALSLKKETIALFFCTPDWEIESYGLIKKLVSPLLKDNFMSDIYNEELTKSISAQEVFDLMGNE